MVDTPRGLFVPVSSKILSRFFALAEALPLCGHPARKDTALQNNSSIAWLQLVAAGGRCECSIWLVTKQRPAYLLSLLGSYAAHACHTPQRPGLLACALCAGGLPSLIDDAMHAIAHHNTYWPVCT